MKHPGWLIAFILGLALGISGPLFAPKFLVPHLPKSLQGKTETVEGLVTRKQKEKGQLLLTVSAPGGATLVTFEDKVKEIDMLVEQEDTITLSVKKYEPFLFDPDVIQVKKPQGLSKNQLPTMKPTLKIEGISIPDPEGPNKEATPMPNVSATEEVGSKSKP
jgi:hypothetical protein